MIARIYTLKKYCFLIAVYPNDKAAVPQSWLCPDGKLHGQDEDGTEYYHKTYRQAKHFLMQKFNISPCSAFSQYLNAIAFKIEEK